MTAGEYLVAHSPLASGTALEHFLALQFGAGQGETVFASRFHVLAVEDVQHVSGSHPEVDSVAVLHRHETASSDDGVSVFLSPSQAVYCKSIAGCLHVSTIADVAVVKSDLDTAEFKINH